MVHTEEESYPREVEEEPPTVDEELRSLAHSLGFRENPEMATLRNDPTTSKEELMKYYELGQNEVDQLEDSRRPQAQLGLSLAYAGIMSRGGPDEYYSERIEDAITHAFDLGLDEIVDILTEFQLDDDLEE